MSDYLWDRSGQPDPEIKRLETLLAPLGHREMPRRSRKLRWTIPLAIAASVLVWVAYRSAGPSWQVSTLAGRPSVNRLGSGQSLRTDSVSRARLQLDDIGEVDIEPDTQLSVIAMRPQEHRLDLKRGIIHAYIWAPPAQFYVNTPSSVTVDLGCAYTLQVDDAGMGVVNVTAGWVAFEDKGRESLVPESAACKTRPGTGPGMAYYSDASHEFKSAVDLFDVTGSQAAADVVIAAARSKDALTLWHLARRVRPGQRERVLLKLAQLKPVEDDPWKTYLLK